MGVEPSRRELGGDTFRQVGHEREADEQGHQECDALAVEGEVLAEEAVDESRQEEDRREPDHSRRTGASREPAAEAGRQRNDRRGDRSERSQEPIHGGIQGRPVAIDRAVEQR